MTGLMLGCHPLCVSSQDDATIGTCCARGNRKKAGSTRGPTLNPADGIAFLHTTS
jgi:hypothetical protein